MKNLAEVKAYCFEMCGNEQYISLTQRPDLIDAVLSHPDYSHVSDRGVTHEVYFYCEFSPTGVWSVASIHRDSAHLLTSKLDALTKALNWID